MRKTDKKYFEKMVEDKDLVKESFNTDDGIRRAAILDKVVDILYSFCVSIPMTVLGGLQYGSNQRVIDIPFSFNTDDGIRRAAINRPFRLLFTERTRFNTDDGIRRAAISFS